MHPYPHLYKAGAAGGPTGMLAVTSPGLVDLPSAPPPEFDGPGGVWSPETMLCAAVADCFVLTFRAIARASKFEWLSLECSVEGTLEREDGVTRFTRFVTQATLRVPPGTDAERAKKLMEKSEHGCLVTNSLTGKRELVAQVVESQE
jgi:organic hydroperoxide reductase OsmC/OhrA